MRDERARADLINRRQMLLVAGGALSSAGLGGWLLGRPNVFRGDAMDPAPMRERPTSPFVSGLDGLARRYNQACHVSLRLPEAPTPGAAMVRASWRGAPAEGAWLDAAAEGARREMRRATLKQDLVWRMLSVDANRPCVLTVGSHYASAQVRLSPDTETRLIVPMHPWRREGQSEILDLVLGVDSVSDPRLALTIRGASRSPAICHLRHGEMCTADLHPSEHRIIA
jgi:hypothetical protein